MTPNNTDDTTRAGSTFDQHIARIAVGAYDDAQDVRTSLMNRIRDIVRKRNEGIPFDEVEDEKDDDSFDAKYKDDNLPELIEEMRDEEKLTSHEFEYLKEMLDAVRAASKVEERYKGVMHITEGEPIFTEWIEHVNGVSTTLTARLLHKYGYCEDFDRVSQLWSYSGLAPGQEPVKGEKLSYDPEAKTLAWLVADRIIMQGDNSRYKREFYDPYKETQMERYQEAECAYCGNSPSEHSPDGCDEFVAEKLRAHIERIVYSDDPPISEDQLPRLDALDVGALKRYVTETLDGDLPEGELNDFDWSRDFDLPEGHPGEASPPKSKGHAHNRAVRYLAKKFLKHYWYIARDIQGLDTPDEWVITHGGHEKQEDTFENPAHARRVLTADAEIEA